MPEERIKSAMHGRAIVDCRNIYQPGDFEKHGFTYDGVGRGRAPQREAGPRSAAPGRSE